MHAKQPYGERSQACTGESACLDASLKSLFRNEHNMELEEKQKFEVSEVTGLWSHWIGESWWDNSHIWSAGVDGWMDGYRFLRKDRPGRWGGSDTLPVREQLKYMELYLGTDQEPIEGLLVGICSKCPHQEGKVDGVLFKRLEEASQ